MTAVGQVRISLIVAASKNDVIGVGGGLPWHLPEELRRFKALTMGKPMIMGRATYESIGRALPGRQSIVLSRRPGFVAAGCDVVDTVEAALAAAGDAPEVMVIGGGYIYRRFLPLAHRIYLTRVDIEIDGDTFFPTLDMSEWTTTEHEAFPQAAGREAGFSIATLERISDPA